MTSQVVLLFYNPNLPPKDSSMIYELGAIREQEYNDKWLLVSYASYDTTPAKLLYS